MNKTPILQVNGVLIVCIQDDLTDKSILALQEAILDKIYHTKARGVIVDISVLDMVDSFLGRVISDTAKMIRLLGARTVLAGMKPSVAITLVELGLAITGITTALDVDKGLVLLNTLAQSEAVDISENAESPGED